MIATIESILGELFSKHCAVGIQRWSTKEHSLHACEEEAVRSATVKRRLEFAAGRTAAREALTGLGFTNARVPMNPDRSPVWPTGTVGSISHCAQIAVAVAATTSCVRGVGIDIEQSLALDVSLWEETLTRREQKWLESKGDVDRVSWATVIFSAKEAFYKMQYPLTSRWVGFHEVQAEIHPLNLRLELWCDQLAVCRVLGTDRVRVGYIFAGEHCVTGCELALSN